MLRLFVRSSLRYRYLVIFFAAALLFFGIAQLRDAPVDVFPEFAPPKVEIQTISLGLSAVEVEQLVTVPLEQALNGVPGLDVMRSKSVPDLSDIVLLFKFGTDEIRARQLVQERLQTVVNSLPTWASPPVMIQPLSSTSRVMKIGITSKEVSLMDLSMTAYWKIRARLLRVPGVANVPIWGERVKMPQIQVDPEKLRAYDVPLDDVMEVTATALDVGLLNFTNGSVIGTGGFLDTPNQRFSIQHKAPLLDPAALAQIPIENRKKSDGSPLRLSDVGDVKWDTWLLSGDAVINGGPGLMLIVQKLPWANTLEVTRGVEKAIDELRPGLPGVEIDTTIFRTADFIDIALENLLRALIIGCILVVLVLIAFLYEWRTALISMVAIPLSLVAGGLVLYLSGATINVMVLAGFVIAIGVVVDDAIIDVENIVRRTRQHRAQGTGTSSAGIILDASLEVRQAIIHATLIDAVTLVPVFFLGGLSGTFFTPLALSYALAVLASMVVALTVTPALCMILLANAQIESRVSPLVRALQRSYGDGLSTIIRHPRAVFGTTTVLMAVGFAVLPFLGQSLLPSFKERDFLMHWITNAGTSHPEMVRVTQRACRELMTIPGVRNCGSHIGQALLADEPYGVNFTENWISVDPAVDYDHTLAKVQETVDGYPGLIRDVQTYLKERIKEVLTGSSDAIVLRIYGQELHALHDTAQAVKAALAGIDGIADLKVELHSDIPQVEVEVDLAKAQQYGLKPGDVRRAAAVLLSGEEVGDIFIDGRTYDVNVWSTPETRQSLTSIRELLMDTPSGRHVRLGDVADVSIHPTPNVVERVNQSRKIDVSANVRGRDLGSVAQDVERQVKQVHFPLGYHVEVLGEYAERQTAQTRLLVFALGAAIGVFAILWASFGNLRLALLGFVTLPSALVGGLVAAFLSGGVLSLGSLVGFLTVFGIAARNMIMLISHYQHLEKYEGEAFGPQLIVRGAVERLSPILMTAMATGLALVPLVITGDIPGHEIEYPMAIVILGGLITSTVLNLNAVPSLYLRFGKSGPADSTPHER